MCCVSPSSVSHTTIRMGRGGGGGGERGGWVGGSNLNAGLFGTGALHLARLITNRVTRECHLLEVLLQVARHHSKIC